MLSVAVAPLPDGRVLLTSGGYDATVRLWDSVAGTAVGNPVTGRTEGPAEVGDHGDRAAAGEAGDDLLGEAGGRVRLVGRRLGAVGRGGSIVGFDLPTVGDAPFANSAEALLSLKRIIVRQPCCA